MKFLGLLIIHLVGMKLFFSSLAVVRKFRIASEDSFFVHAGFFLWAIFGQLFWQSQSVHLVLWLSLPTALLMCIPAYVRSLRAKKFDNAFLRAINVLILRVRLGKSFREARKVLMSEEENYQCAELKKVFLALEYPEAPRDWSTDYKRINEAFDLFRKCETDPHLALKRLLSQRRKIEIETRLKKKINVAIQQNQAQAAVVSLIFGALVAALIFKSGLEKYFSFLFISTVLFAIGLFWMTQVGRKIKWTI